MTPAANDPAAAVLDVPVRPGAIPDTGRTGRARRSVLGIDPALIALTALAFAVAAYRLGTKGLWLDEAVSADHARLGLDGLWKVVSGGDPNMGLYYALLHVWVRVFGYSEAAVRSLSLLLGGLAVPVIALLGRRLFGRGAGLAAGLLLALSPFFVQYEQTARSYALLVLLVSLSSYLFVLELEQPSRAHRIGYVLASTLAVYAHYMAVFVLLVQLVTLLAVRRRGALTVEWTVVALAMIVLCMPEVVFALRAGSSPISWLTPPTFGSLVRLPGEEAGSNLIALLLVVLAAYGLLRGLAARDRFGFGFVALWLLAPPILDFIVSRLVQPLFLDYYLIIVLPAFVLLAAAGLVRLPGLPVRVLVLAVLVILAGIKVADWYRQPSLEGFRDATGYIVGHDHPGDRIIFYPAGTLQGPTSGVTYYEQRLGGGPSQLAFGLDVAPPAGGVGGDRIWLVMRDSDVPVGTRAEIERSLLRAHAPIGSEHNFRNLTVILYASR
jgi:mannosyltransferase